MISPAAVARLIHIPPVHRESPTVCQAWVNFPDSLSRQHPRLPRDSFCTVAFDRSTSRQRWEMLALYRSVRFSRVAPRRRESFDFAQDREPVERPVEGHLILAGNQEYPISS